MLLSYLMKYGQIYALRSLHPSYILKQKMLFHSSQQVKHLTVLVYKWVLQSLKMRNWSTYLRKNKQLIGCMEVMCLE